MDPVKARKTEPVKAPEAPKRVAQQAKPESKPEAVASKKAPEQAPRPTTNTRGETLGRLLNVSA
jgi:hypothetical protein